MHQSSRALKISVLLLSVALLAVAQGKASAINWGVPMTVSGDADVNTNGTAQYAFFRGSVNRTIDGVTFTAQPSGQTWGNVSFSGFGSDNITYGANAAPFNSLSTAYTNVLSGGVYGGAATGTVTLGGLTFGHAYTVQIWVNDARSTGAGRTETISSPGGNTVTLDYNSSNAAGGVGQYVVGTFVASGANQIFTVASSSSAQVNAISVRDNGIYTYMPNRVNLAKYQPVMMDSTNGTQTAAFITQGFVDDDSCWISDNSGPHWAEVDFPFPVTVGSAQVAMGQKNASPLTVFYFQYLTNGNWVTVPGSTVSGNSAVEQNIVFSSPVTGTAFRLYDSLDNPIRIRQLALYPPNGAGGYPFGTDFNIDLARKQPVFATANTPGGWPLLAADGLVDPSSAWQTKLAGSNSLLINLQFTNKLGSAHLYSGMTGVAPISNFVLQYWTGSAWANIPGGSVTGNTQGARVIPFSSPVSTTKVQLVFTNSGTSAVQELCVFPANSNGGYPLGTGIVSNTPVAADYETFSDSYYYLSNTATASVIVESNGIPVMGTPDLTNGLTQYQVLLNYDNGTYRLINRSSGLCLAGAQMTTNVGAALADEVYLALPDQDWYLQTGDGTNFYFVNQFSGLALDEQGGIPVQNAQTNSPTQLWQIGFTQIFPKKGIAGAGNFAGADRRVTFNANWSYSWWYSTGAAFPTNFHYFPMDPDTWNRGGTVAGNLWSFQPGWRTTGYSLNVLGYNEPDQVGQANLDATNGAIYWMNDQNLDLPLVGPAAANVNGTWNQTFYGYITNWGCRVDYMPAHEYPGNNSSASSSIWINPLQTAYNTYGMPMWMTEWSVVDWGGTGSWSEEDNYNALAEFLWRAESISWLRKYSLFLFQADTNYPMAVNPWTRTTPAPRSNSYDTNGNLTPFGELYAAWDEDANVETNKIYFIHNNGTRKRLENSLGSAADATDIRVNDFTTKWTLQSAGSPNLYYIVSALDGRRLSYNGSTVGYVAAGTTGTAVQWSLTAYQYGWFYLDHPATSKRLQLAYNNSTSVATFSMVANTTTTTAVQWRFIATLPPPAWTGYSDNKWSTPGNWNSQQAPLTGQSATFNNQSIANLNTLLDTNFSLASVVVTTPGGPVSIGGTNTLSIGAGGIDLSAANQNLTIAAPVVLNGSQTWNVANNQSLMMNGDVSGSAALTISGGGTVSLGSTATHTGGTTISAGTTVQLAANNVLPNGTNAISSAGDVTNNGTLNLAGTAQAINGLSGSGIVDNTAVGAAALTIGVNNDAGNFTGTIQNNGGDLALLKTGTGGQALRGTNSYAGGTIVNGGSITFYTGTALGSGPVTVNAGGIILGSGNFAIPNPVTLNSGILRVGGGGSHALTNNALVSVTGNSLIQADGGTVNINLAGGLDMGNSGSTLTNSGGSTTTIISGPLTGDSSGSIFVTLSETLWLSGSNSFAGTFRTPTGTLSVRNDNALRNATLDMNAADTGTVYLNNYNAVIGALTGSRSLGIGSGAVAIGNNNASTTYSGTLGGTGTLNKIGAGTLTLAGTNIYTGNTTISGGTLALGGTGSVASPAIIVAGGATLDVSGLTTPFTLAGRTLTNNSVGAVLNGNNDCSSGALSLVTDGLNPAFIQTNGTMTISTGTIITVNNVGAALSAGAHPLINAAMAGNVGAVTGTLPSVAVTGNGATGPASLQINGTGGLDLVVDSMIATNSTNISYTIGSGALTLSWPVDHLGWIAQSNAVDLGNSNFWFDIVGSQTSTNLVIPVNPAAANVFYRLRYPN